MKSLAILVSILLATCSANSFSEKVISSRQTRSNQSVTAWVNSDLGTCLRLPASVRSFCGTDYNAPSYYVTQVSSVFTILQQSFNLLQAQLGSSCAGGLKNVICNGAFPKCSADSSTATYGDFSGGCSALSNCGTLSGGLSGISQFCQESGKTFSLRTCQKFSGTTFNSQYCGNLPQNIAFPSWLVQGLGGQSVAVSTLQTTLSTFSTTASCKAKWTNMVCVLIPFCSSDRTKLLSAVTESQCRDAIACLPSTLQTTLQRVYDCSIYPKDNGQKMCMPATQAYQNKEVTSSSCNSATGLAMGSALLYLISYIITSYMH